MSRLTFPDKIPMHYRESFFRDPFFSDCWNIMDKNGKVTEKHTEKTSTRSSSTREEVHEEVHEEKLDEEGLRHLPRRTRFQTTSPTISRGSSHEERSDLHEESTQFHSPRPRLDSTEAHSKIVSDAEKFQVMVEVDQFKPEELTVKTMDHYVIVEGRHEERKQPRGYLTRQFTRKYLLPIDCKPENVSCNLSADGILVVSVPRENIDLLPLKEVIIEIEKSDKKFKKEPPTAAA